MSLMPTLLIGIWRVSACPCTSSTGFTFGFLTGTATFIFGIPTGAIRPKMVPKPRNSRILDDSSRLGCTPLAPQATDRRSWAAPAGHQGLQGRRSSVNLRFHGSKRLNATLDDVRSQPGQHLRASVKERETLACAMLQFPGTGLGGVEPEDAGVCGLGAGGVRTGGLAQILGASLHVADVVLNLKREPDVLRVSVERIPLGQAQPRRTSRGQQHARTNQRAGLEAM